MTNKHSLYKRAFDNTVKRYHENTGTDIRKVIKQLIVYGVKAVNTIDSESETLGSAPTNFHFCQVIISCMSRLTPLEFINLFPITKDFDGERWGTKDYFYTMKYIKTLDPDAPIGEEIFNFLWEYTNWEITIFNVNYLRYISDMRQLEGKPSLMEEWANQNGISTYTLYEKGNTKFVLDNRTGKTTKVKKPRPSYLKLVK